MQPHYANTSPAPVIAELPAPLPPAPPTTTPSQQLKEDELLARKISQIELADARRRSSGAVSQITRSTSMLPPSPQQLAPLAHQMSSQSLRPYSHSVASISDPWSQGSLGLPPNLGSPSSSPEVVSGPSLVTLHKPPAAPLVEDLPIPVLADRQMGSLPSASFEPTSLSTYLEEHRQIPYPPQWRLPPVLATFYAYQGNKISSGSNWLDTPDSCTWRPIRPIEHVRNPLTPTYTFKFKSTGGSFRSPKFSWVMTCPEEAVDATKKMTKSRPPAWNYELKLDSGSGMRKTEVLSHGRQKAVLTTYVHALNYDSLRFIGPDGRAYMWVSSAKVSSVDGSRYDTLRHALFAATGNIPDPLYGEIVADHTFWDGYIDENEVHTGIQCDGCQTKPIAGLRWRCRTCSHQDVCNKCRTLALSGQYGGSLRSECDFSLVNLPDEALNIRSQTVDSPLVVATLQVLKDWEKRTLRNEKKRNAKGFFASEEAARKCDLGIMSYWRASDWGKMSTKQEIHGTRVKAKSMMLAFGETAQALGNVGDAAFALAGIGATSSGAGDSGGSGSHAGGDGGGG
jgi:hypothetical protein